MMNIKFIHTADWQIGKPFTGVPDIEKREKLRRERIESIYRIGEIARKESAEFILVAGDLFDSPTVTSSIVADTCSAIGSLRIPVYAIPGNHDHGGPGSLWEQDYFKAHCKELAPNLIVLLSPEPYIEDNFVILPCPLLRRHDSSDLTEWIRNIDVSSFQNKFKIILAHGSVVKFSGLSDDDEEDLTAINHIGVDKIPEGQYDYMALGDWHGTKQINTKCWYSGTPELDRFVKGDEHDPGNILVVNLSRDAAPKTNKIHVSRIKWHDLSFQLGGDDDLEIMLRKLDFLLEQRSNSDLMKLSISGSLGLNGCALMEKRVELVSARLIRLKLINRTRIHPTQEEIDSMIEQSQDPLISGVAAKLMHLSRSDNGNESEVAGIALRHLFSIR